MNSLTIKTNTVVSPLCIVLMSTGRFYSQERRTHAYISLRASPLRDELSLDFSFNVMINCTNHKWEQDVDTFILPPACVCVLKHPRDFLSDLLTLDTPCSLELSCPIYNRSQCDLYPAMTIMYFSTCQSQVSIIPCVVCFVLHVLQSPGTFCIASVLQPI